MEVIPIATRYEQRKQFEVLRLLSRIKSAHEQPNQRSDRKMSPDTTVVNVMFYPEALKIIEKLNEKGIESWVIAGGIMIILPKDQPKMRNIAKTVVEECGYRLSTGYTANETAVLSRENRARDIF